MKGIPNFLKNERSFEAYRSPILTSETTGIFHMKPLSHITVIALIVPYSTDFIAQLFVFLATRTRIFLPGNGCIIDR